MVNWKIGSVIFLGFFGSTCFSQSKSFIYGGADFFRNTNFVTNSYFNLNVGSQLFRWEFIAPEIGYELHFGRVRDNNQLHPEEPNARAPFKLRTKFSTSMFSVAPKVIIGNQEAAFVFIPQYNMGNFNSRGDLLSDTSKGYTAVEEQQISSSISFWSFAAGVEGQFYDSDFLHFSLMLKYHLLNTESIFNQIDLKSTNLKPLGGSADGIGISFRVYLDFFPLLLKE